MAISDPRKIRPVGQLPEQTGYDAEEDPLVELARIVSEDSGFSARRGEKARPAQQEPDNRSPLSADLEAELLHELESSFAARQASAPQPRPKPAPASVQPIPIPRTTQPAAVAPTPVARRPDVTAPVGSPGFDDTEADELLRSIEEQLGQFERRAQALHATPVVDRLDKVDTAIDVQRTRPDPADAWRPMRAGGSGSNRADAPAAAAAKPEYRFRGPAGDHSPTRQDNAPAGQAPKSDRPELLTPSGDRATDQDLAPRAEAASGKASVSEVFDPAESIVKRNRREMQPSTGDVRMESRINLSEVATARNSADAMEAGLANVEAEISREFEPRYADAAFAGRQGGTDDADEPRVESVAAAREQIGRPPSRNHARRQRGGARKGLLTAASVVIVAAIGAAAAMYLRTAEEAPSGPPPVIASPEGVVKVEPQQDEAAANGDTVGEAVYNRVAGNAPSTEEQVVDSAEEPREIARIVLPTQAESEGALVRSVGEEDAATAAATDAAAPAAEAEASAEDEIGPRRVQTFTVRPDGTIVRTDETAAAPDPAADQQQQLAAQTEEIEPVPVATVAIGDPSQAAAEAAAPALRPSEASPIEAPAVAAAEPIIDAPADLPADAPPQQTAVTAPQAAVPAASIEAGAGYHVQVSSQRSREQADASFADLQSRYASVLGGLNASVQEADLGEKGIYYRVRVGPWASREEAVGVCEALKGAGGACFVTE